MIIAFFLDHTQWYALVKSLDPDKNSLPQNESYWPRHALGGKHSKWLSNIDLPSFGTDVTGAIAMIRLLTVLTMLFAASAADAAQSVYTKLNFDNGSCKSSASEEDESTGVAVLTCPGYAGYQVLYNEGDARVSVSYGDASKTASAAGWESFSAFNSVSTTVEWRLDGTGSPYAAIQRYMISAGNDQISAKVSQGQVLVISKVGQARDQPGCVVGLVDALANANPNELARQIADEVAPGFGCRRDDAVYHGKRRDKASDFNSYRGDQ